MHLAHLTSLISSLVTLQNHLSHMPLLPSTTAPPSALRTHARPGTSNGPGAPAAATTARDSLLPATAALLQLALDPAAGPPGISHLTACLSELAQLSRRGSSSGSSGSDSHSDIVGSSSSGSSNGGSSNGSSDSSSGTKTGWQVLSERFMGTQLLCAWLLRCALCEVAALSDIVRDPKQRSLYSQFAATSAILYARGQHAPVDTSAGSTPHSRGHAAGASTHTRGGPVPGLKQAAEPVSLEQVQAWASQLLGLLRALSVLGSPVVCAPPPMAPASLDDAQPAVKAADVIDRSSPQHPQLLGACAVALLRLARHGPHVVPLPSLLEGANCLAALGFACDSPAWRGTFLGLLQAHIEAGAQRSTDARPQLVATATPQWHAAPPPAASPSLGTPFHDGNVQQHTGPDMAPAVGGSKAGGVLQPVLQVLGCLARLGAPAGPALDSTLSTELLTFHLSAGLVGTGPAPGSESAPQAAAGRGDAVSAVKASISHADCEGPVVQGAGAVSGSAGPVTVGELVGLLEGLLAARMPGSSALGSRLLGLVGVSVGAGQAVQGGSTCTAAGSTGAEARSAHSGGAAGAVASRAAGQADPGQQQKNMRRGRPPKDAQLGTGETTGHPALSHIFGGSGCGHVLASPAEARRALAALLALGLPPPPHTFARLVCVGLGVWPGVLAPGDSCTGGCLAAAALADACGVLAQLMATPQALQMAGKQEGHALRTALVGLRHAAAAAAAMAAEMGTFGAGQSGKRSKSCASIRTACTSSLAVVLDVLRAVVARSGPGAPSALRTAAVLPGARQYRDPEQGLAAPKASRGWEEGQLSTGTGEADGGVEEDEEPQEGWDVKGQGGEHFDDFIEAQLQALRTQRKGRGP